jgi:hypothetical protein
MLYFYICYFWPFLLRDSPRNIESIRTQYERKWDSIFNAAGKFQNNKVLPPNLVIERFIGQRGSPCWIWNGLASLAYDHGHDYLFQLNDDTRIFTSCWASTLSNVLARSPRHLGVVGPQDLNNNKVLTLAMVHRTHYEIFRTFYPPEFRNWFSDDWLSQVYGKNV